MEVETILRSNPFILHDRRRLRRGDHIETVRRRHRLAIHLYVEAVRIEGANPIVGDLESPLTGALHKVPDILFLYGRITLLNGLDDFIERNETELIHIEAEFVWPMTQDEGKKLGNASAIWHDGQGPCRESVVRNRRRARWDRAG